jgi:hypothetical protein
MALPNIPQYTVYRQSLVTAQGLNTGGLVFQNVGYFKVIRFEDQAFGVGLPGNPVLTGQIDLSLGTANNAVPVPLLYNNEMRFPEGSARIILSWAAQANKQAVLLISPNPETLDLDTPNPQQLVTSALGNTITVAAVTVTDVATLIVAANTSRYSAMIQNVGAANPCAIGPATVTFATGPLLNSGSPRGDTMVLDKQTAAIYGICGAGLSTPVRVLIESTT